MRARLPSMEPPPRLELPPHWQPVPPLEPPPRLEHDADTASFSRRFPTMEEIEDREGGRPQRLGADRAPSPSMHGHAPVPDARTETSFVPPPPRRSNSMPARPRNRTDARVDDGTHAAPAPPEPGTPPRPYSSRPPHMPDADTGARPGMGRHDTRPPSIEQLLNQLSSLEASENVDTSNMTESEKMRHHQVTFAKMQIYQALLGAVIDIVKSLASGIESAARPPR